MCVFVCVFVFRLGSPVNVKVPEIDTPPPKKKKKKRKNLSLEDTEPPEFLMFNKLSSSSSIFYFFAPISSTSSTALQRCLSFICGEVPHIKYAVRIEIEITSLLDSLSFYTSFIFILFSLVFLIPGKNWLDMRHKPARFACFLFLRRKKRRERECQNLIKCSHSHAVTTSQSVHKPPSHYCKSLCYTEYLHCFPHPL